MLTSLPRAFLVFGMSVRVDTALPAFTQGGVVSDDGDVVVLVILPLNTALRHPPPLSERGRS